MKHNIDFSFTLRDRVKDVFDRVGFIDMLGYDEGGRCYHVVYADRDDNRWWYEMQLLLMPNDTAITKS